MERWGGAMLTDAEGKAFIALGEDLLKHSKERPELRGTVIAALLLAAGLGAGREMSELDVRDFMIFAEPILLMGLRMGRAS
jgi:hypothetical protein